MDIDSDRYRYVIDTSRSRSRSIDLYINSPDGAVEAAARAGLGESHPHLSLRVGICYI